VTRPRVPLLLLRLAFVLTAGIAGLSSLGLTFGAWAAIASEGQPDSEFSWARYFALIGGMAAVAVVAGLAALIFNRRLNVVEGRAVGDPTAVPNSIPPERT
jgi:hypothetical protein